MSPPSSPLRCLITAGPTREHLDPVRFLSNGSSGKMGYALAAAAAARGWQVDLVSGPVALPVPAKVNVTRVISAADMLAACTGLFPHCDMFIAVAAVADYRPRFSSAQKGRKQAGPMTLELEPTVDILKTLAAARQPGQVIVGFAAETTEVETHARRKLVEKQLDWIAANDVSRPELGMNADDNAVLLLGRRGERVAIGPAPKIVVAQRMLELIAPA
ncbi:MAG: phosphopantothenoylcysteine decarboxylase [Opitutaceae bacterium]|nr:phosphopantothenoylcysteine decarboxylase [Opitutaceae bacterium]